MTVEPQYLAGLLDGDGSISIVKHTAGRFSKAGYVYYCLAIQLSQLDTPEFRTLAAELGCRVMEVKQLTTAGRKVAKIHWWSKKADALLKEVGPLLRLKARQWLIVQAFWAATTEAQEAVLKAQMITLNKVT